MTMITETATMDALAARQGIELALRLGEPEAARAAVYALLRHCPAAGPPLVLLGQALLELGQIAAAVAELRRALALNALDAAAWAVLAGALAAHADPHGARDALERAALHDPLGSEWLVPGVTGTPGALGRGVLYLRRGHPDLAAAELSAALTQHPARHDLRVYLAEALRRCGQRDAARAHLRSIAAENVGALPLLLLQAALGDDRQARGRCARYDPDGQLTRRFFAPEALPWALDPPPVLPADPALERVVAYLPTLPVAQHKGRALPQLLTINVPVARVHSARAVTHVRMTHARGTSGVDMRPAPAANRTRYITSTAQPAPTTRVLLSSRAALAQRYGAGGWRTIDQRLKTLVGAWQQQGVDAHCCYIDDPDTLTLGADLRFAAVGHDAPSIRNLALAMAAAVEGRGGAFGPLLIVGDDEIIPFHRLPNPLADGDQAILSDNPYGCDDDGYILPQRIVARIPTDASHMPVFTLGVLDRLVGHARGATPKRGGLRLAAWWGGQAAPPAAPRATGYCAEAWQAPARAVLAAFDPQASLHTCPPLDAQTFALDALASSAVLYVNLHGAQGRAHWYGQPEQQWSAATRLPLALRPEQLAGAINNGLLVSEACYGMEITGRTAANSIPLRALSEGALGCVGATVNAYGSYATPLLGADLLCERLLTGLARGLALGEALFHARQEYAQTMYRRQGYLDDTDVKTLLEFVVLGDPDARATETTTRPVSQAMAQFAGLERVPKPRQRTRVREGDLARPLRERARAIVKRIMPQAAGAPLHISVQQRQDVHAKSMAADEFIIRVQSEQPTSDEHLIPQTAVITLSERAVVKIAVTR